MRRRFASLAIGLSILAVAPGVPAAAATDQATGAGKNEQGEHFNVSAHGVLGDASGHAMLDFGAFGEAKGDVDCLNVQGNRAAASGPLDQPLPGFPGFPRFVLFLEDNGNGGNDPPDRFRQFLVSAPSADCFFSQAIGLQPLVQGNIEIKDRIAP